MKAAFAPLTAAFLLSGCCTHISKVSQPLFDGKSLAGWRAFGSTNAPAAGWTVTDGMLHKRAGVRGGDIVTTRTFTDFDLSWEWRVAPGGNNGVKYLVNEARKATPGHEYQMLDDTGHPDGRVGAKRQTAAFYDVLPPAANKPYRPAGEWNSSRIIVSGQHVQHWLNGTKVLSYELGSPETKAALARSKFKDAVGFGDKVTGPILLTDHQDETWFQNIVIRELR
jgi:hypothetical protein